MNSAWANDVSYDDIDKNLNNKLGKKYKSIPINNPNVAFNDKSIKCIFIATSTKTHLNYIDKAVRNKKVVFCEKPSVFIVLYAIPGKI